MKKGDLIMKKFMTLLGMLFSLGEVVASDTMSIYVIRPKFRISWNSPSSLLFKTALNSIRDDYAPIGHFAVELKCSTGNNLSINHVMPGMERVDKKLSQKIVLKEKLGLGSLFYSFEGRLVSSAQTKFEIEAARKDKRLKKMTVSLSPENCQRGMEFIEAWIQNGSYSVYGGGKNTLQGEGAGCADFANTLFKVTTNYDLPPSWIVRRKISTSLIGGKEKKINFLKLLFRENWVKDQEDYLIYETADTNQAFDWIEARVGAREEYHYQEVMMKKELLKLEGAPIELSYQYEMNQSPGDIWGSIKY